MPNKMYLLRVIYSLMAIVQIFIERDACASPIPLDGTVIATLVVYPHVGHLLFGRLTTRRLGHVPFLADGAVTGMLVAALGFQLVPSVVLVAINLFNWIILGGATLATGGAIALIAGIVLFPPAIVLPFDQFGSTCIESSAFASAILLTYLIAVGTVIFARVGELRHAQETLLLSRDAANGARKAAESALLAALPRRLRRSDSSLFSERPLHVEDALVARLCLSSKDPNAMRGLWTDSSAWVETVRAIERALNRHQIDVVKTHGLVMLAFADGDDCVDRFLSAVLEARQHLADHGVLSTRDAVPRGTSSMDLSAVAEMGDAEIRIVQPERLDVDIFGETMSRLDDAFRDFPDLPPGVLILSASARRGLSPRHDARLLRSDQFGDAHFALSLI